MGVTDLALSYEHLIQNKGGFTVSLVVMVACYVKTMTNSYLATISLSNATILLSLSDTEWPTEWFFNSI